MKCNMSILLRSPAIKVFHSKRKLELAMIVSLFLLSLVPYYKCQKHVCGTKANEAIDVMWMIHTENYIVRSDFLVLKQFLSDMMLWFRISFSNTDATRHGCLRNSGTNPEVFNYDVSVDKVQNIFRDFKQENTTEKWLAKALDYLANSTVTSDRQSVPNVAVVVTAGEITKITDTITAATELTKAGWKILFLVVPPKVDSDKIQRILSEQQLHAKNVYIVSSLSELQSLEFQEQFARAICDNHNYIEETKRRMRRNNEHKYGYVNIAQKKPASQSSTLVKTKEFPASLAVDGNVNDDFSKGFCSSTKLDNIRNWWEVDLKERYDIEYVSILDTSDSTKEGKHKYFEVIGHNGGDNRDLLVDSQVCGSRNETALQVSERFKCSPILDQKRYVKIEQNVVFKENGIVLCEVEVHTAWPPGYHNIAIRKTATESSSYRTSSADLAIDGNTNGIYTAGSCSRTEGNDFKQWWLLDLEQLYNILGITVFNRMDDYFRLKHFDVAAYKEIIGPQRLGLEICGSVEEDIFFSLRHFWCELFEKRYIIIEQNKEFANNYLTLCEVEVWGDCEAGTYGRYCKETCENCDGDSACDKVTGACAGQQTSSNSGAIAGSVVVVLLVLAGATVGGGFYYKRMKRSKKGNSESDQPDSEEPAVSLNWLWEKDSDKNGQEPKETSTEYTFLEMSADEHQETSHDHKKTAKKHKEQKQMSKEYDD